MRIAMLSTLLLLFGCDETLLVPDGGAPPTDATLGDLAASADLAASDLSTDGGDPCARKPAAADRDRYVVIAHPFAGAGVKSKDFEVLKLSAAGKLSKSGQPTFQLGSHATSGVIAFTPDGKVGLVPLGDGNLGVIELDAAGKVTVLDAGFKAPAWINAVVMAPDGKRVYALSSQWRNSGGGVYELAIGCDGSLSSSGLLAASKLPYALALLSKQPGQALVASRDVLSSKAGDDVHLLDLSTKQVLAGVDAFGDDEAIISAAALTHDGRYLLVADANAFSTTAGNRVAAVELLPGPKLRAALVLKGLDDPASLVTSPYDNAALVVGAQANAITVLNYTPSNSATPFSVRGPLTGSSKPKLRGRCDDRARLAQRAGVDHREHVATPGAVRKERKGHRGRAVQPGQRLHRHPWSHRRPALIRSEKLALMLVLTAVT
jgi:hypothetical protein